MQMTFFPSQMHGSVIAPASKSESHRQMICAGLTNGTTVLSNYMSSNDMDATISCLSALGVKFSQEGSRLTITKDEALNAPEHRLPVLDCGESGSTLRFFVPISLALTGGAIFRMHGKLGQRPMEVYRDLFVPRGVDWHMGLGPDGVAQLTVEGRMESGEYVLPGNVSSQFVSGMLFALPLLDGSSVLKVIPPVESAPYINMTLAALEESGISFGCSSEFCWEIPGNQEYHAKNAWLSGDWSQAAVFLCASALGHKIWVQGLGENRIGEKQGDASIISSLEKMGARKVVSEKGVTMVCDTLKGCTLDMHDTPDIAPVLALVCQKAQGESRLINCGRLRMKECDRLHATVRMLNDMGGCASIEGDTMIIEGTGNLRGGVTVEDYRDHRMVMLAAIAGSVAENPVTVGHSEAVNKSWPGFFQDYSSLGGVCTGDGGKM